MSNNLKALGKSAHNKKNYTHTEIATGILEAFPNPSEPGTLWEHIDAPEFTCLCPITGQPDFAHIHVYFSPVAKCVESKSYKLYLGSFRNVGMFHEAVAARIRDDLLALLKPEWLLVVAIFTPRGGIAFRPRAIHGDVPEQLLYIV